MIDGSGRLAIGRWTWRTSVICEGGGQQWMGAWKDLVIDGMEQGRIPVALEVGGAGGTPLISLSLVTC